MTFCHVCVAKVGDGVFDLQLSLFGRLPLGALGHRICRICAVNSRIEA